MDTEHNDTQHLESHPNQISLFVAFGSEEQGLFGATAVAQDVHDQGLDLKYMCNIDMIGNYDPFVWDVELWVTPPSRPYAELMSEMAYTYTNLNPLMVPGPLADASPFDQLGY